MRGTPKERLTFDRIKIGLSIFCFLSLALCGYGLANTDNYLDFVSYTALSAFVGIIMGILFSIALYRVFPSAAKFEGRKETPLIFLSCFAFVLFSIGFTRLINEWGFKKKECHNYKLIETGSSGSKSTAYYVFIQYGNRSERLEFPKTQIDKIRNSDSVYLCIETGLLGFAYFKLPTTANHDN